MTASTTTTPVAIAPVAAKTRGTKRSAPANFDAVVKVAVDKAVASAVAERDAQIALLNEKLALARELFAKQRDEGRALVAELAALRAAPSAPKSVSAAKAAYLDRADQGRKAFNNAVLSQKQRTAAFYEAHPGAKSATYAEINDWFNQPAPVVAE